ncbi:MAG TPA: hypothetical protein VF099_10695 [Ktedonobacterales bacterium]
MAKTLLGNVSETLTPPRRRWMPWRRKTLTERVGERVGDVTERVGQTASDLTTSLTENLTPSSTPRWLPWRRKTLADQVIEGVGDVTEQVSGAAGNVAGQVGQASSGLLEPARTMPAIAGLPSRAAFQAGKLVGRLPGLSALPDSLTVPLAGGMGEALPSSAGQWGTAADVSAERAAFAAEAAAQAAQRAVGLMERVGGWVGLLAGRATEQEPLTTAEPMAGRAATVAGMAALAIPAVEASSPEAGTSRGVTNRLKQAAMNLGERVNDWSDGRYGLEPQKLDNKAGKAKKKSDKQRERLAEKAAKEAAKSSGVRWLPWMIGLSIGLVFGLVGVAYWQRQRLQHLWGETSQRARQATDNMRQRIEASRSPIPQTIRQDVPPTTPNFTPLGSVPPVTDVDQPGNGRLESTTQ